MEEDVIKNRNYAFDLIILLLLTDLSMVFVLVPPFNETYLRIILALLILLFIPGYALVSAIFPKRGDLSGLERLTLSIGLSIAITVFNGFALSITPWQFRPMPIIISLSLITAFFTTIAAITRRFAPATDRFSVDFSDVTKLISELKKKEELSDIERALVLVLASSIIIASSMFIYASLTFPYERFTALYILGEGVKAENYPHTLYVLEPNPTIVSVENYERSPVNYTLQIRLNGYPLKEQRIFLNHEEKWRSKIDIVPKHLGKRMKLEFVLFKEGSTIPYRSVHLWVNSTINFDNLEKVKQYVLANPPVIKNSDMEQNSNWKLDQNTRYFRSFFTKFHRIEENSTIGSYVLDSSSGLPIPSAIIRISNHYGYEKVIKANENGYYETKIIADHFWVSTSAKGYKESKMEFEIKDGETLLINTTLDPIEIFNMTMKELAALNETIKELSPEEFPHIISVLEGYVINEFTGRPIPNATVKVTNEYGFVQQTKTDESGYFMVKIISGEAIVEVTAEGYAANRTSIIIASVHEVILPLPPKTSKITGYVYDSVTKTAIPNALISARSGQFYESTSTNKSGYFEIKTIPGKIRLIAGREEYFRNEIEVEVQANEISTVEMLLDPIPPPSLISGYVTHNGEGAPGVEVVVNVDNKFEESMITDAYGYFEIETIPGHVQIEAIPKVYMNESMEFNIKSGQKVTLNISLNAFPNSTYQIIFPSETQMIKGYYGGIYQEVVSEEGFAVLSFKVSDSYKAARTTKVMKEVLINDIIVWEDDVGRDEGWEEIKVPVTFDNGTNKITLRVHARSDFKGPLIVSWDDIKVEEFSEIIKEKTTIFKILDAQGYEESYPSKLYLGEPAEFRAVIENNEHEKVRYLLQVKLGGELLKTEEVILNHGEKWEGSINFTPNIIGKLLKLEFLLFKNEVQERPYRYFHLWVSSEVDYGDLKILKKYGVKPPQIVNADMESPGGWLYVSTDKNFTAEITDLISTSPMHSYEISYPSKTYLGSENYAALYQNFTVDEVPANVVVSFAVRDSYTLYRQGNFIKQVLLNNEVIWEDDVAGDEGWMYVKTPITLRSKVNTLMLRVYAERDIRNFPIQLWWDDVQLEPITKVAEKIPTIFKILDAQGYEESYPSKLYLGEPAEFRAVIENNEHEKVRYLLQVKLGGELLKTEEVILNHGEKWEGSINFTPNIIGKLLKLEFLLFKNEVQERPYRYFHLWVSSELGDLESAKSYEAYPTPSILNGDMESRSGWKFVRNGSFWGRYAFGTSTSGNFSYLILQIRNLISGEYAEIYQNIEVRDPGVAFLLLKVMDNYDEQNVTGCFKQLLLNGEVIWEDDVAGKERWQSIRLPVYLYKENRLSLKVYAKNNIEKLNLKIYWDDIRIKSISEV